MVALLRWVDIFTISPVRSVPGRMLLELWVICFVKKSTSTIKTGAGSMGMFCSWRVAKFPGQSVVPLQESRVYDYGCMCRDAGRSASPLDTL